MKRLIVIGILTALFSSCNQEVAQKNLEKTKLKALACGTSPSTSIYMSPEDSIISPGTSLTLYIKDSNDSCAARSYLGTFQWQYGNNQTVTTNSPQNTFTFPWGEHYVRGVGSTQTLNVFPSKSALIEAKNSPTITSSSPSVSGFGVVNFTSTINFTIDTTLNNNAFTLRGWVKTASLKIDYGDGTPVVNWNFPTNNYRGNGGTYAASHQYSNVGTYTASFTVYDHGGSANTIYRSIEVKDSSRLIDLHHATGGTTMGLYTFSRINNYATYSSVLPTHGTAGEPQPSNSTNHKFFMADVDGDQKVDLIDLHHKTGGANMGLYVFSASSGFLTRSNYYPATGTANDPNSNTNHKFFMVDMDADGKADLVDLHHATGGANMGLYVFKASSNFASSVNYFPATGTAAEPQPTNTTNHKYFLADVDGDQKPDLVDLHHAPGGANMGLYVFKASSSFATRLNYFPATGTAAEPQPSNNANHKFFMADMDNDGKADLVDLHHAPGGPTMGMYVFRAVNNFSTYSGGYALTHGTASEPQPSNSTNHKFFLADMDGDSKLDLVDLHHKTGGTTMGMYVFSASSNFATKTTSYPATGTANDPNSNSNHKFFLRFGSPEKVAMPGQDYQ
jgi:hypothetical protein